MPSWIRCSVRPSATFCTRRIRKTDWCATRPHRSGPPALPPPVLRWPCIRSLNGIERRFCDYVARGVPYGPDDGTIAPWAVVASLPFAPEIVLPAIDYLVHEVDLKTGNPYGFKATFNPTYPDKSGNPHGWVSPWHYGINQRPINPMIENYRTGLPWRLMRGCPYIVDGLRRAGFTGGWL